MRATGPFDVKVTPQPADDYADGARLARLTIDKTFHGDLDATSRGQMLSAAGAVKGSAGYVAIERVTGTLAGRSGSFVLQHDGMMTRGAPRLVITVVPDSGTDELTGLAGTMSIDVAPGGAHAYVFEYTARRGRRVVSGAWMRGAVAAACAVALAPHGARAQTVGGEIVGLQSGKPVHGANVALVDDSANIVTSAAADTANGMFYIDAPHAGHYRVVLFVPGGSFVSPAIQLDSAQTVERKFSVPEIPGRFGGAYFAQDVTSPARLIQFRPAPLYPETERATNMSGLVVAMFVVDEHGHADPATLQIVNDAGYDFAQAVRGSIANAIYMPATKDGTSVRQVVQLSIGFGVKEKTPNADVMVTALGIGRLRAATVAETTEVIVGRARLPGASRP